MLPQPFEIVELADRLVEDVDDHVAAIEERPLPATHPLDRDRPRAHVGERVLDRLRDALHLAVGARGADDQVVGDRREPGDVENDEVESFLVQR